MQNVPSNKPGVLPPSTHYNDTGVRPSSLHKVLNHAELLSNPQLEDYLVETRLLTGQETEQKHHQLLQAPIPERAEMVEMLRAVTATDFSLLAPNDKLFVRMMARGFLPGGVNHFPEDGPDLTQVQIREKSTSPLPFRTKAWYKHIVHKLQMLADLSSGPDERDL
jgi:hypothetical protein